MRGPRGKQRRFRILAAAIGVGLSGSLACEHPGFAQEAPIVPPSRRSVRIDNDPLKQRSATENVVFGRIVDVDDHRLILQESGPGETPRRTTLRMAPDAQIVVDGRATTASRVPRDARVSVYLQDDDPEVLNRIVIVNDDETQPLPAEPETPSAEQTPAPRVDTKVTPEVDLGATLGTATDGVAVVRLEKNSPLARAGLQEGDRIRQVAGRNVLTPDSIYRVLNEFDGGTTVELVVLRTGEELTYSLTLPEDHQRLLVDGVEPVPLARDREADYLARGDRDQGLLQRLRELERRQVLQQRQIDYLYRALVATRDQLGYPAFSTAFPAIGGPGGTFDPGTGENGEEGTNGTDPGDAPTPERPVQRERIEVEDPTPDLPIFEPRQPAPERTPRQVPRANPAPRQPASPPGNAAPRR